MIDLIEKVNNKVTRMQKALPSEGFTSGKFPVYSDAYPCLGEFSSRFWQYTWHKERNIEYFKSDNLWLSKQLFICNSITNNNILLDLEYYSYIESIYIYFNYNIEDMIYINVNDININHTYCRNNNSFGIDLNYILMLNDYINISINNNSGIVQIKYRLIG